MGMRKREPSVEELLSDPMMETVFKNSNATADDVRSLMRDARGRLERPAAANDNESEEGGRSR